MSILGIVAMSPSGKIGYRGQLLWRLPDDMRWFRKKTMGQYVVMGRKAFLNLPEKMLYGRRVVVVSKSLMNKGYDGVKQDRKGRWGTVVVVPELGMAFDPEVLGGSDPQIVVAGGARIYEATRELIDGWYVTVVDNEPKKWDAVFPGGPLKLKLYIPECRKVGANAENPYAMTFYAGNIELPIWVQGMDSPNVANKQAHMSPL